MSLPVLMFDPTTPDGKIPCGVDFTGILVEGVAIAGVTVGIAVHALSIADDEDADDRLSGSASIDGNLVTQMFQDGVEGADYVLTYLLTLSDGEIEPIQVVQQVRKYV